MNLEPLMLPYKSIVALSLLLLFAGCDSDTTAEVDPGYQALECMADQTGACLRGEGGN